MRREQGRIWKDKGRSREEMTLQHAKDLKIRTKLYALAIIQLVSDLPRNRTADILASNCYGPPRPLERTTGKPVEPARKPSSSPKLETAFAKLTNQNTGSNSLLSLRH